MMPRDHAGYRTALTSKTVTVFAVTCGLSVGNIYAAQPLLDAMGASIGLKAQSFGSIITVTQVGYALGLGLIVPLGDLVNRRRQILVLIALSIVSLIAVAAAQSEAMLFVGLFVTGLLAVVVQTLVAFAASLATAENRGAVVGKVTSGIVLGILGARVVAGAVTDLAGWRVFYLLSALAIGVMLLVLWRLLPSDEPIRQSNYIENLRSLPSLFLGDRVLLLRSIFALAIFAVFSTFWTALVLPLEEPPFSLSHGEIGLFGLVGIAGTIAARGAGRLADRGLTERVTGGALLLLCLSWSAIVLLPFSLLALVIGVVVLDLAVQAVHVTNLAIIVSRHPGAQSRAIAGYMIFYSAGSALGAFGSTRAFSAAGWTGVCFLGGGISLFALIAWAVSGTVQSFRHRLNAGS